MRVAVGFDHAGFVLRETVESVLQEIGAEVLDMGTHSPEPCDYVPHAFATAEAVSNGVADRGVICCGTGLGSCIAAGKVRGVRAVTVSDVYSARMSRLHNDANLLCLGGRVVGTGLAREILVTWLSTPFSEEERHKRRLDAIAAREEQSWTA